MKNISTNNTAINLVSWPIKGLEPHVCGFSTTRLSVTREASANASVATQQNVYQSFNLGLHVGDNAEQVEQNRADLLTLLPANSQTQWLEQVHGNHVAKVSHSSLQQQEQPIIADGAYTRDKKLALAVMTADCLPILLTTTKGDEIAAVHGGWRSLASNILANALAHFQACPEQVVAWLGPCIGPQVFEVGSEVKAIFAEQNKESACAFTVSEQDNPSQDKNKYFANLQQIARMQLQQLGVSHISALPDCTYQQAERYYSYRREQVTGRMASVICLS